MPATDDPEVIRGHFLRAVEDHCVRVLGRPELLNRLGENIVVFQPIRDEGVRRAILQRKVAPLQAYLQERFGVQLQLSDELADHCVLSARTENGGRGVVNALEQNLLNPLARFLFDHQHQLRRGRSIYAGLQAGGVDFELRES